MWERWAALTFLVVWFALGWVFRPKFILPPTNLRDAKYRYPKRKLSKKEQYSLKNKLQSERTMRQNVVYPNDAYLVMRNAQVGPVYPWKEYVEAEKKIVPQALGRSGRLSMFKKRAS